MKHKCILCKRVMKTPSSLTGHHIAHYHKGELNMEIKNKRGFANQATQRIYVFSIPKKEKENV